jgi:hypothetical protein
MIAAYVPSGEFTDRLASMGPRLSIPEQVASQAEFIVDNLQTTKYQHHENIDVDRGVYECDCNGFVSFVMMRAAPDHYAMIPKESDQPRPRAFEYYMFLSSQTPSSTGGWHRINLLKDARRGDMIAWRFPEVVKDEDTGHVLFVADSPVADDSGIFTVRVYDSAVKPHFEDTRGTGMTGVGAGSIKFKVDNTGRPTAFQFTPSGKFETFPIAIGRVEPLPPLA